MTKSALNNNGTSKEMIMISWAKSTHLFNGSRCMQRTFMPKTIWIIHH